MDYMEQYNKFKAAGDFVVPPSIRRKAKHSRTQKKRRLNQRRTGRKKKGGKKR